MDSSCTRRFGGSGRAKSSWPCGVIGWKWTWQHAKIRDPPGPIVHAVFDIYIYIYVYIHTFIKLLNGMEIGDGP